MRILAVPNWSFGRDQALLRRCREILASDPDRLLHYCEGDVDHNRTVTAFSGPVESVFLGIEALAAEIFPRVDLNRHVGVHPRVGALDVCPIVPLAGSVLVDVVNATEAFGKRLAESHDLPVFLYEKSERGRHEADLPTLRKGGFGGLLERDLKPDFGPVRAHERLGVTILGVRDFLIAMNVDLRTVSPNPSRAIARRIRDLRAEGDPRFLGVRALGFSLASRNLSQVSLNLTLPDLTPPDPIIEWVRAEAAQLGIAVEGTELIGVIRERDLAGSTRLPIDPAQVVPGA